MTAYQSSIKSPELELLDDIAQRLISVPELFITRSFIIFTILIELAVILGSFIADVIIPLVSNNQYDRLIWHIPLGIDCFIIQSSYYFGELSYGLLKAVLIGELYGI